MPRAFDGTDDEIRCAAGNVSGMTFGSFAVIVRRGATGAWHSLFDLCNSSGVTQVSCEFRSSNELSFFVPTNPDRATATTFTSTTTWYLILFTKATGTATPRAHIYNYSTNAWTHENFDGTLTNWTSIGASGTIRFGEWEDVDDFQGDLACAGIWSGIAFTDAKCEAMGLQFDLMSWFASTPSALWLFDQQAVGQLLRDLTGGGANQSTIAGTSLSANSVPRFGYGDDNWLIIRPQGGAGAQSITPSGLASQEAFGVATLGLYISPSSLASAEAVPSPVLGALITASGIASLEAVPSPLLTLYLTPPSVDSQEAVGSHTLGLYVLPGSITSQEAVGSHQLNLVMLPPSISSQEAVGTHIITMYISPAGAGSGEAVGGHTITSGLIIVPAGLASEESVPGPLLTLYITPSGVPSGEAIGGAVVTSGLVVQATGLSSQETIGAHTLGMYLNPAGLASLEAIGSALLGLYLLPISVGSQEAIGAATLAPGVAVITSVGVPSAETIGQAVLTGIGILTNEPGRLEVVLRVGAHLEVVIRRADRLESVVRVGDRLEVTVRSV